MFRSVKRVSIGLLRLGGLLAMKCTNPACDVVATSHFYLIQVETSQATFRRYHETYLFEMDLFGTL